MRHLRIKTLRQPQAGVAQGTDRIFGKTSTYGAYKTSATYGLDLGN
jgi:hypothetical protein